MSPLIIGAAIAVAVILFILIGVANARIDSALKELRAHNHMQYAHVSHRHMEYATLEDVGKALQRMQGEIVMADLSRQLDEVIKATDNPVSRMPRRSRKTGRFTR